MNIENKKTILVVEDDVPLQKAYETALTRADYKVIFASTGSDGLLKAKNEDPQLIILDLMLHGKMNGFDVLEQLKANHSFSNTPIFILTNLDSQEELALKIGINKYFIKANISIDDLIDEINKALNKAV